jgi:type II secretory pathway component PulK
MRPQETCEPSRYGVRREAKRHAAFPTQGQDSSSFQERKAVSALRSATALHKTDWRAESGGLPRERGSVLIIVLWVALGLITISLYFAQSMSFEMRAADNRVAAIEAQQAVTGAARYVSYLLGNLEEPGLVPDPRSYLSEAVPVGESYFWLLGRSTNGQVSLDVPFFGLVDEASKLNLNTARLEMLQALPRMTPELAAAIVDWHDTDQNVTENGAESETYMLRRPAYRAKDNKFESIEELRLVKGAYLDILYGEDTNGNGVLDPNENDGDATPPSDNRDGRLDAGILEYLTVYSREGKLRADGTNKIDVTSNNRQPLIAVLRQELGADRADEVVRTLGQAPITSLLEFYTRSTMTLEEFAKVEPDLTEGQQPSERQVNVNTAPEAVLACIPGIGVEKASSVVAYRQNNSANLQTVGWLVEPLGRDGAVQAGRWVTTHSYQFTADICAVGRHGRGFQRVKFVIDTSEGTPQIRFRQDLSQLGWPLGQTTRTLLAAQKENR